MLTPDRWNYLESLFLAAVDLPEPEREAFIAEQAAVDPEIGVELSGMLAHASGAGGSIASVIASTAQQAAPLVDWIGRRVGAYRIVREIGRGGMGLVFEATRDDAEYRKQVALKVVPWWRDAALLKERFRQERQILANLDHPNIARLLDGGTDHGVPYFAMEFVEGVPITTYCERRALDIRQRVELFRQVCGAVHFAHQSLVVHRDLKPGNIFVDATGTPKLLDFGIAKLTDASADPSMTTTGAGIWTPDYASPEQVRGQAITTRADVYSLGLVLYEVLTGARGQTADQSSALALDRSVCETEPPLPSERLIAAGRRTEARRLRGDLDTIVLTALRKEQERRYGSAAALSDDLGRWIGGQPILARPSTPTYRAAKFLRRHRVGAAAAALVVASLGVGLASAVYEARRAERHFDQVRHLANAFVFDVHDRIERLPGSTEARQAIVRTALTYLEGLRNDAQGDDELARELARAYLKVGDVQGNPVASNLGDTAGAVASFTRVEELLTPLAHRGDRAARLHIAQAAQRLASIEWARGNRKAALDQLGNALTLSEHVAAEAPSDKAALSAVGDISSDRARYSIIARDFATATADAERAMRAAQRILDLDPRNLDSQLNVSTAHNAVGAARIGAGDLEGAADAFRAAVAIRERLVAQKPNDAEFSRNLLIAYGNLGDILAFRTGENLGDPAGAAAVLTKAVALAEKAAKNDAADRRALFDLESAKLRLGSVMTDVPGQAQAALDVLEDADRISSRLLEQEPGSTRYGYNGVVISGRLGVALSRVGRPDEAARQFERVRQDALSFANGPNAANARVQIVLASARLATLRAATGDDRAVVLADFVSTDLAAKPLGLPIIEAQTVTEIGRAYLRIAARHTGPERDRLARVALSHLEQGAHRWRTIALPAQLESRRKAELAAIDADLPSCRKLLDSSAL